MGIFRGRKPPPVINRLDNGQQIANKLAPINYASVIDQLSGNKLDIIRGGDGKVGLAFSNNRGNRIDLESPIKGKITEVRQKRTERMNFG